MVGVGIGVFGRWVVARITRPAVSSLGVITLAIAAISHGASALVGGSGFLAVNLTGAVAASRRSAREVLYFHEGLAANAQGVLFLRSLRPLRAVPYEIYHVWPVYCCDSLIKSRKSTVVLPSDAITLGPCATPRPIS